MRNYVTGMALVLLVLLAGCDQTSLMKAVSSPADEKVATHYIELLHEHKYDKIEQDVAPSLHGPKLHEALMTMAGLMPPEAPGSVKLVGAYTNVGAGYRHTNYTFEYTYPDRWLLINIASQKKDGVFTVVGFNVQRLAGSLENLNRFTLVGKSPLQYLVLACMVLVPLFCLYVTVLAARTPIPRRKWLWIVFILLGVGTFSMNWATGHWGFMPLSFQVLGAAFTRPLYGPWTLSVSFPLGAIWFLARRSRFLLASSTVAPEAL